METALARYDVEGVVPTRTGDNHPSLAPFETFAASDGKFVICAGNDTLFLLMADALGEPQLALNPLYLTNDVRVINRRQMVKDVECITLTQPMQHWIDALNEAGVPCSPINTIDKLFTHPQLLARSMIVKVESESGATIRTAGNPIKMSSLTEIDPEVALKAPALNEHREAILAELMADKGAYEPALAAANNAENNSTETLKKAVSTS